MSAGNGGGVGDSLPMIYADLGELIDEVLDEWTWPIRDYSDMRPWLKRLRDVSHRLERQSVVTLRAFDAIAAPTDSSPYIEVYRNAGGGYEGLQAIARAALAGELPDRAA